MAANSSSESTIPVAGKDATSPENTSTSGSDSPHKTPASPTEASIEERGPSNGTPKDDEPSFSRTKRYIIIASVTLVYFLVMLDSSIISTAIPQITDEFNSLLDVGWYSSTYLLASSAFVPLAGKIYTYFSTKWSFLVFFTIFELGSALCGAAQSSVMLIVGRAIAGLGASGLMNGILTILAAILPPHRLPRVMGLNVSLGQVGMAGGPLIGGALTQYATWRWCACFPGAFAARRFYINLPVGAVVGALLIMLTIPEVRPKSPPREVLGTAVSKMDLLGLVLLWPATIMFFLALEWGGTRYAWSNSRVIGNFLGAAATLAVFLVWEWRRGDDALIPFSFLRVRVICFASATMFFFIGVMLVQHYYVPIYFQAVKDNTPFISGVHILPTLIPQMLLAISAGTLIQWMGYYLPWAVSGTALTAIGYGLYSTFSPSTSIGKWIGYQILAGIGNGAAASSSYIAIQNTVPRASIPTAMAILILCQNLGAAVFLTLGQAIFSNSLHSKISQDAPGVSADAILAGGARMVRQLATPQQLSGVVLAYSQAIDSVMYLGIALGGCAFLCAWGLGWKDIRQKE